MRFSRWRTIAFAHACATRKEPVKFTAKVREMLASLLVRNGSSVTMPAALTLMSMEPKVDSIWEMAESMEEREVTSVL